MRLRSCTRGMFLEFLHKLHSRGLTLLLPDICINYSTVYNDTLVAKGLKDLNVDLNDLSTLNINFLSILTFSDGGRQGIGGQCRCSVRWGTGHR